MPALEGGSTISRTSKETPATANEGLQGFDTCRAALAETHVEIPRLLEAELELSRQLGRAQVRGGDTRGLQEQIQQARLAYEVACLRRRAAADAVSGFETQLRAERIFVERTRQERAAIVVEDFKRRYIAAVEVLQRLWAEGDELHQALNADVPMAIPARVRYTHDGLSQLLPVKGNVEAVMDAELTRLSEMLAKIDRDLTVSAGVKSARAIDERSYCLDRVRGEPTRRYDVYRVVKRVFCQLDSMWFESGQLIDVPLVGAGNLKRMESSLRPIDFETAGSASTAA
jgi:hypothetical protein